MLAFAASCALLALLLPLSADQGEVLFLWTLRGEPGMASVLLGQLFVGLAWLALSRARTLGAPLQAALALALLFGGALSLSAHPEATAHLLPHFPSEMQAGVGWLFIAIIAARAAGLYRLHPQPSRPHASALMGIAGLSLAALYLLPHHAQTLAGSLGRSVIAVFDPSRGPEDRASIASMSWIPELGPLAVVWALGWARWSRTPRSEPWSLVTVPLLVVALSAKAAASLSDDALVLVGLRASLLLLAGGLVGSQGLFIALGSDGSRLILAAQLRRWLRTGSAKALGLAIALASIVTAIGGFAATEDLSPPLRETVPTWALDLFEQRLPDLAIASDRLGRGVSVEYLNDAIARADEAAAPAPRIRAIVAQIGEALPTFSKHRRSLRRSIDALNLEARRLGLPLYADLEIQRIPRFDGDWKLWITTYRVERIHRASRGAESYESMWLTRLDHLNIGEQRLGYRKVRQPHAIVMLDVVRRHWAEDLAPALAERPRRRVHPLYRALREAFIADLSEQLAAVPVFAEETPRTLLEAELDCRARFRGALAPELLDQPSEGDERLAECRAIARRLEVILEQLLARRVELHELQHLIDDRQLTPPEPVLALTKRDEGLSIDSVTAEISAHLAEVARSDQPRLALAHLFVLGDELGGVQEASARVVFEAMASKGESRADLLLASPVVLRRRAHQAYVDLFDCALAPLSFAVRMR